MTIETVGVQQPLFYSLPDAIVIASLDRVIRDVNPAFCRMFGYAREEIVSQSLGVIFRDQIEYHRMLAQGQAIAQTADVPGGVSEFRRSNGRLFSGQAVGGSLYGGDERPRHFFISIRDLDDPDHVVIARQAEREVFELLYHETPALLHSIDRQGVLRYVSDGWLAHFGYERHEVVGRPWRSFLTNESRRISRDVVGPAFWREGTCDRVPFEIVTRQGGVVEVELSAIRREIDGVAMSLSVSVDVTERNRALREAQSQNAALRDFAAFVAHDLQAPLRHLGLFAEELLDPALTEQERALVATRVREKAHAAQAMVRALLDYSRAAYGAIRSEAFSLESAAETARGLLEREICESGAAIVIPALPQAFGDRELITRVFQNLFHNAIRHSGEAPPIVRVEAETVGGRVRVRVSDNGAGVDVSRAKRLFRRHDDAPNAGGLGARRDHGLGIGLSICRQIIDSHGGVIEFEDVGSGAAVRFDLPRP